MFDTYSPYQFLKPYSFDFKAKRFAEWIDGKLISEGKPIMFTAIYFDADKIDEDEYVAVWTNESEFEKLIDFNDTYFEKIFISEDRIVLTTIPPVSNKDIPEIIALRQICGITRFTSDFKEKEPYCCIASTIKSELEKLTFFFSNPKRIVEFYKSADSHSPFII